jgi:hypothetical protein
MPEGGEDPVYMVFVIDLQNKIWRKQKQKTKHHKVHITQNGFISISILNLLELRLFLI